MRIPSRAPTDGFVAVARCLALLGPGVLSAVMLSAQLVWSQETAVGSPPPNPSEQALPERYGDQTSDCAAPINWAPHLTLLMLSQPGETGDVQTTAFRETLESYLGASVHEVTPGHYGAQLLEGTDGLVVLGKGAFSDPEDIAQALADARARGIPVAWVGLGAEAFAGQLHLAFGAGAAAPEKGQIGEIDYQGVGVATGNLVFARLPARQAGDESAVLATARGSETPVIVQRNDLAFIGFIPFDGSNSRLPLVAAIDTVSRLFGRHPENRRVVFRLEDISALNYGANSTVLSEVTDFLLKEGVFMHLGVIAQDVDQNPALTGEAVLTDIGAAATVVRLAFSHPDSVEIVQHGYRHFRHDPRNANCESPGCGYEFFEDDDETMGPEAAAAFARQRLLAGRQLIARHLPEPFVYEAPHYTMSPAEAAVAEDLYPLILHAPNIFGEEPGDFFMPWFTHRHSTFYGPSDVGYVASDDPQSVDNILAQLDALAGILPDPVATVFFHPFMFAAEGREHDLERLITGIRQLGYRFVSSCGELAALK